MLRYFFISILLLFSAVRATEDPQGKRFSGDAEYLCWWANEASLPVPIVTTGSFSDSAPAAIGQPSTKVLFGEGSLNNGAQSGFRVTFSGAVDKELRYGIGVAGF